MKFQNFIPLKPQICFKFSISFLSDNVIYLYNSNNFFWQMIKKFFIGKVNFHVMSYLFRNKINFEIRTSHIILYSTPLAFLYCNRFMTTPLYVSLHISCLWPFYRTGRVAKRPVCWDESRTRTIEPKDIRRTYFYLKYFY